MSLATGLAELAIYATWIGACTLILAIAAGRDVLERFGFRFELLDDALKWGKLKHSPNPREPVKHSVAKLLNVPKSWFSHFYILSTIESALVLGVFSVSQCHPTLDIRVFRVNEDLTADATSSAWTLLLLLVQSVRRTYECYQVSVFSPQGQMHILHYLTGLFFYPLVCLTIVVEAHIGNRECVICWANLSGSQLLGIALFIYASIMQADCHQQLASLRQNPAHRHLYYPPPDSWFRTITCPHYTAEILIYLALTIVDGFPFGMLFMLAFVVCNLGVASNYTREWYISRFPSFPANKARLLPGLF